MPVRTPRLRKRSCLLNSFNNNQSVIAEEFMKSGNTDSLCKNPLCLIVKVKAVAGKEAQLKKVLSAMLEPTRKEPGCITYQLYANEGYNTFYFYELWETQAHLDAHTKTEHYLQLVKDRVGLVDEGGELSRLSEVLV
jgi:quinol monooxygenase YgiN